MKMIARPDLLTHPIRGRIMMTLAGRNLTTRQVAALLPDVPPPSLYRQLRLLLDGGAIQVVGEAGTGRAAQRIYARSERAGELSREQLASATPAEVMELFSSFLGILLAQFQAALRNDPSPATPLYLCGATPLVLPAARRDDFVAELHALIARYQDGLEASGERAVFATILFSEPALPESGSSTP